MAKYTKKDIIQMVEDDDVEFIRLQFTDIFGALKNVAITASQIEKVLDNGCMFDGSSIEGFARIEESDMYLVPDLNTFEIFPWRPQQGKVARLICDVYKPNGEPFEGDPRYILKKVTKENGIDIQYVKVRDEEKNRLYTDEQKAIIEPYIQDYMSNNDEGVLTLYVPLVLVVKDGKVVDGHEGTLESHDATERKMTNDEKEQLTKIYTKLMSEAN